MKRNKIRIIDVTESTNSLLKAEAEAGSATAGTVIRTHFQTAGKGRLDRQWDCPPGKGLIFSLLFKPDLPQTHLQLVGLMASLAVLEGILKTDDGFSLRGRLTLKWPNDILGDGSKICGILCESGMDKSGGTFVIVGIGLNVLQTATEFPSGLRRPATSLYLLTGKEFDMQILLDSILNCFNSLLEQIKEHGTAWVTSEWMTKAAIFGKLIRIDIGSEEVSGTCMGLSECGGIILKLPSGKTRTVYSGDVA